MPPDLAVIQDLYQTVIKFLVSYSFQLLGGLVIVVAGFIVARWAGNALLVFQARRNVDVTLRQFISSTVRLLVIGLFVVVALAKIGISITPLIAAIGGLAVGASFAIQGPVSNYGAGLIIILTRMFKVGDTISVQGCSGVIDEITLATTRMRAEDGEVIVIPNKHIVGEIHRNSEHLHIVEGEVGIAYSSDPIVAIAVVREALATIDGVVSVPRPLVGIECFRDTVVVIGYRYWAPTRGLFGTKHTVNGEIYTRLTAAGLCLHPSREIMLLQGAGGKLD
ncbi:MAG: mechanosensitive ion channel family protein [Gammaproteobacteria bacterium]|nr:mechanosensitive ion channel family protein [Gammaproteobacteria bacterium]